MNSHFLGLFQCAIVAGAIKGTKVSTATQSVTHGNGAWSLLLLIENRPIYQLPIPEESSRLKLKHSEQKCVKSCDEHRIQLLTRSGHSAFYLRGDPRGDPRHKRLVNLPSILRKKKSTLTNPRPELKHFTRTKKKKKLIIRLT